MEHKSDTQKVSEEELDAILAAEAGMTVDELRERSAVELTAPWESEIISDHE